jgi:ribosomal protein L19
VISRKRICEMIRVVNRRWYRFTKQGELYSRPPTLKSQTLYHPVLGEFQSENTLDPSTKDASLIWTLRNRTRTAQKFQLGSIVHVQSHLTTPTSSTTTSNMSRMVGLVVEVDDERNEWIRVRSIVYNTGTELKIPLASPLIQIMEIAKPGQDVAQRWSIPPSDIPTTTNTCTATTFTSATTTITESGDMVVEGPNLLGVREGVDRMTRWIPAWLLTEKGRMVLLRAIDTSQAQRSQHEQVESSSDTNRVLEQIKI